MGGGMQPANEDEIQLAINSKKKELEQALNSAQPTIAGQIAAEIATLQGLLKEVQSVRLRDEAKRKKIYAVAVAIDTVYADINKVRLEIKRAFASEAFDTGKWIQQAHQFNQRLETQILELDAVVDVSEELKAQRKREVNRIGHYHEVVDQLLTHLNNSSAFISWLA